MSDNKQPVIGSVELSNARMYYIKHGNRPMVKVDELPEWVQIPQRVIDPLDLKKLKRLTRETPAKARPGITIRVLRSWYESTIAALKASSTGGTVHVPEMVKPVTRDRRVGTEKVGIAYGGFSRIPSKYTSFRKNGW